jgi:succinoglycan biosynthesis transport protein ExoP
MATVAYNANEDGLPPPVDNYGYGTDESAISLAPILRQALAVARRNIWLIGAIITTFVVAAMALTILQTPKYTAFASIEISTRSDEVLGEKIDPTQEPETDNWDIDRFLNTQINILTSRSLAERVARRLNLYTDPAFFNAVQINPDDFQSESERRNEVIDLLQANFTANLPDNTRVARIRFTSTDPKMSADIANAFASEFIQANLQRRFDSSSYARNFVQQQLEEARARLEQSEGQLNAYAREAGLIRMRDPSTSSDGTSPAGSSNSITATSLMQVNQAVNEAKTRLISAETRWNAERAQSLLSSPAALSSPVVQNLMNKRSDLQAQLLTARARYKDDHPTVQSLTSQLQTTNELLTQAATEARNSVKTDYAAARAAAQALQGQVDSLEAATMREQDQSVRYNTLAREADTNRSIYDGLLQRFRELNASAGITASNLSVVDKAEPPTEPSSPNIVLNLLVALTMGIVVAGAVVILKDQLDDRIRIPEEVEQKVGLALLGVIPEVKGEDAFEALGDPKSPIAESYSALRSSLLYSTRNGLPQLILVTSAQASEGKSTTSFAVARGMALIGKRTLLVDGDLRRPSIHHLADVQNATGLASVLVGEVTVDEAVTKSPWDNLWILPSGPTPPSPAELLSSPRLIEVLRTLRQKFDVIIIDSAPVLGLADSPGLAALSDGVLMVIEANRGRGGHLKAAVRRLRMMKPTILGAVLTKFDPEGAGNAYSMYYQYEYYQYHSDASA